MYFKKLAQELKRGWEMRKYPTADRNANIFRICLQAVPYFLSSAGFSLPPLSVFIHVNTICNLKCKFCDAGQNNINSMFYSNLKGGEKTDMPLEDFKKIIDKIKHFKPFVGIPALEPGLYPHIIESVRYIVDNGMRCSIATNGTMLEEKAEKFIDAGLTKVVVSIDGPESHHDKIRGVPGTFKKVVSGIKAIDELKKKYGKKEPYIYVNYVTFEDNSSQLVEMVEQLPLRAIQQIDFRVMFFCTQELAEKHNMIFGEQYDATSACLSAGIDLKNVDIDVLHKQIKMLQLRYPDKCKIFFNYGKEGLRVYYHEPEVFLDDTKCVFPWYTMQINTDGTVIPPQRCYKNVFGNILDEDFWKVWNGPKMRQFRKDLKKYGRFPACTRCEGVNY